MKTIKKFLGIKISLWVLLLIGAILLVTYLNGYLQNNSKNNSQSSSMVQYIEEANEVVFLNVGIEKVVTATNQTTIPWTDIGIPFWIYPTFIIITLLSRLINEEISEFLFLGMYIFLLQPGRNNN